MGNDRFVDDRRGVSITVSHVLTIAITAVLISGLIVSAAGALSGQRERAAQSQVETVGQRLAFEIEQVDSLAARGGDAEVTLDTDHTNWIVNSRYEVTLTDDPAVCETDTCLRVTALGIESAATIGVAVSIPVDTSTAPGGSVRIVYDGRLRLEESP